PFQRPGHWALPEKAGGGPPRADRPGRSVRLPFQGPWRPRPQWPPAVAARAEVGSRYLTSCPAPTKPAWSDRLYHRDQWGEHDPNHTSRRGVNRQDPRGPQGPRPRTPGSE